MSSAELRKVTRSLYTNDDRAGSAGNVAWILGRLSAASVTASAPGLADGERNASFTYQNYGGDCNAAPGVAYLAPIVLSPKLPPYDFRKILPGFPHSGHII